jgi:hypothetical protein
VAYDLYSEDEDEKNKQAEAEGGGPSGIITGNGPGPSAAPQSKASDGTGEYVELTRYLDANRDRHQGEQVAGRVGEDVTGAEAAQNELGSTFRTQADQNVIQSDDGLLQEVKDSPTAVSADSAKKAAFTRQRDAEYKGPTLLEDLDGYGGVLTKTSAAKEASTSSKSEPGRDAILEKYYGRPQYTGGERALDQYLVANDDRAPAAFDAVQKRGDELETNLSGLSAQSKAYGTAAKDKTQASRKAARDTVGIDDTGTLTGAGAIGDLNTKVDNAVTRRKAEYDTELPKVLDALSKADLTGLTPQERAALGLDDFSAPLYDTKAEKYLAPTGRGFLTRDRIATADQAASMKALAELAGVDNTMLAHPELAGTMDDEPLYSYDKNALSKASAARGALYQGQASTPWAYQGDGVPNIIQIANQLDGDSTRPTTASTPEGGIAQIDATYSKLKANEARISPGYADWAWNTYLKPERDRLAAYVGSLKSTFTPDRRLKK